MTTEFLNTVKSKLKNEMDCKETMNQITYGQINTIRVMSWGVTTRTNFENKGLCLKVNGHHHKGYVLITLDWSDTYDVHMINNRGVVLKTFEQVYFDDLNTIIDGYVEDIPENKF